MKAVPQKNNGIDGWGVEFPKVNGKRDRRWWKDEGGRKNHLQGASRSLPNRGGRQVSPHMNKAEPHARMGQPAGPMG